MLLCRNVYTVHETIASACDYGIIIYEYVIIAHSNSIKSRYPIAAQTMIALIVCSVLVFMSAHVRYILISLYIRIVFAG